MTLTLIRKTQNGYVIESEAKGEYVACNREILFSLLNDLIDEAPTPPSPTVAEPPHHAAAPPPELPTVEKREDI